MSNHINTDAGRLECGFAGEGKDCVVRALATVAAIPYTVAHRLTAELGRKPRKGFRFAVVARRMGYTEHCQPMRGKGRLRVRTALKKYAKGRFAFSIRGHVFAVVDGVIHDTAPLENLNCIVRRVFQNLTPVQPVAPCPTI